MAIQKLEVHGYRSFENVAWEPGKLNLLVGPNGSGKSNLLRLLELISNTARGRLLQSINDAGGIVPLLWNQEADSLGWELRIDPVCKTGQLAEIPITFSFDAKQLGFGSGYCLAEDLLWLRSDQERPPDGARFWRDNNRFWIVGRTPAISARDEHGQKLKSGDFDPNESLLAQVADTRAYPISAQTKRTLEAWRVHHDVDVSYGSPARMPAITQHSTVIDPDGSNLPTVLHTLYTADRRFRQEINAGMMAAFGKEFEELVFQPAAAQRIQLAVHWRSSSRPHAGQELSDGTLKFLFLLAVFADPEPPPLIAIDEPEAGLHPSMFPIVGEYAAAAAERTQVVITSHSPEFLDAFTAHQPHVTICHWEEGRTHLFPIPPERLQAWLGKYRLGHLFTSGELDILAMPEVEVDDDMEEGFRDLPPEGLPLPPGPANPEDAARG